MDVREKMAIYLNYEGIKGNVTADGYEGHVLVDSASFAVGRKVAMEPGKMTNREISTPSVSEVTLSKKADISVVEFFKKSVSGASGKTVDIKCVRTGSSKLEEYLKYTLHDCIVSGYAINIHGDEQPRETITLSFSKCEISYTDHNSTNKSGNTQRAGYDLEKAKLL